MYDEGLIAIASATFRVAARSAMARSELWSIVDHSMRFNAGLRPRQRAMAIAWDRLVTSGDIVRIRRFGSPILRYETRSPFSAPIHDHLDRACGFVEPVEHPDPWPERLR